MSDSGSPESAVTLADVENDLAEVAREVVLGPRFTPDWQANEAFAFLTSELFERRVLRQGWGAPGMRADRESLFMKNYVVAMWRYWGAIPERLRDEIKGAADYSAIFSLLEPFYRQAAGRLTILLRMLAMRRDDVVFLPNVPRPKETFTVARIDDAQYVFDERRRAQPAGVWENDYGHCRRVRDVRQFEYGSDTLPASIFGPPYLHAIDRVTARERDLREFIDRHYSA